MPHSNAEYYRNYYVNQAQQRGGSLPAFHGAPVQQGYGLGSMLKGLFRWAMPHVTAGAKSLGRQTLKGGLEVARDVMSGQNVSDSLKTRAGEVGQAVMKGMVAQKSDQTGGGLKKTTKRKNQRKPATSRQAKKQKTSSTNKQDFNFF